MKTQMFLACALLSVTPLSAMAQKEAAGPEALDLIERYDSFVVHVEYTLQYDRGQAPPVDWMRRQSVETRLEYESMDWSTLIDQERPAERVGYLVGPDLVLTEDIDLHPRFIKKIQVRRGETLVDAERSAVMILSDGVLLKLDEALHETGLTFDGDADQASKYLRSLPHSGAWLTGVGSLDSAVWSTDYGWTARRAPDNALILDEAGEPVGLALNGSLNTDGRWRGSPLDWQHYTQPQLDRRLERLSRIANMQVPRVELRLRSPKTEDSGSAWGRYRYGYGDDDEDLTQWHGPGVMLDNETLLVLASFKPSTTARLETIRVHLGPGEAKSATFVGSLRDYGAFVARLDEPTDIMPRLSDRQIRKLRHELLLMMNLSIRGEHRIAYYQHERIAQFTFGWRRQVYPMMSATVDAEGGYYGYGSSDDGSQALRYLFDREFALAAIPIAQRAKVTVEEDWETGAPRLTPISYLTALVDDLEAHLDANNVPLPEEEEDRIAWLGVELQRIDPELARINDIADITNDGSFGAFVTYVYEDSPAQRAGLKMGDVVLKLHVEGYPKPIEVYGTSTGRSFFPWDQFDETPVEYIQELPTPWPNAESRLTLAMTQVGFGTPFTLEYHRDGETMMEELEIEQSPPFYGSAARYKNEGLELTVRDLTYEVQRYFQRKNDDPGVIISKVESGSKADVAGLRPYEIITRVNDQAVHDVDEFKAAILDAEELRFEVRRMHRGRIVKIRLDEPLTDDQQDEDSVPTETGAETEG